MKIDEFENKLMQSNLSKNTIDSYIYTVRNFYSVYEEVTKKNLLAYKGYLVENFKPKKVNIRILALNKYLEIF